MTRAFTLIEMLVAVAIVGVLLAIAVPTVSGMRARAHATQCLSNLKHLGVALQAYLAEHNQQMPVLEAGRTSSGENVATIDNTLDGYVDDPAVFACPADPELAKLTGTSYYWNVAMNGQSTTSLNFLKIFGAKSSIPVMSDKEGWHKHRDRKVNILYADGHATKELQLFASP